VRGRRGRPRAYVGSRGTSRRATISSPGLQPRTTVVRVTHRCWGREARPEGDGRCARRRSSAAQARAWTPTRSLSGLRRLLDDAAWLALEPERSVRHRSRGSRHLACLRAFHTGTTVAQGGKRSRFLRSPASNSTSQEIVEQRRGLIRLRQRTRRPLVGLELALEDLQQPGAHSTGPAVVEAVEENSSRRRSAGPALSLLPTPRAFARRVPRALARVQLSPFGIAGRRKSAVLRPDPPARSTTRCRLDFLVSSRGAQGNVAL